MSAPPPVTVIAPAGVTVAEPDLPTAPMSTSVHGFTNGAGVVTPTGVDCGDAPSTLFATTT